MANDIMVLVLGWGLGTVTSLLVPEWKNHRNESRNKKKFEQLLEIEIEKLKKRLQSNIDTHYLQYGLNPENTDNLTLLNTLINNPPVILGDNFNLIFYQENYKNLIYSDDEKRKAIINVFERLLTMNSYLDIYKDISSEKEDESIVTYRNELIVNYLAHLRNANEEISKI